MTDSPPPIPLALVLLISSQALSEGTTTTYTDSRGQAIAFPSGDASFADEITSFTLGTPAARDKRWADPNTTLGPPDCNPRGIDPANPQTMQFDYAPVSMVRMLQ